MMKRAIATGLLFIGLLASCEEPDDRYRGLYVFGSEVETFQPCASEKVLWVRGTTELRRQLQSAHQRLTSKPYQGVYVELKGRPGPRATEGYFPSQYEGQFFVEEVLKVRAREARDCVDQVKSTSAPGKIAFDLAGLGEEGLRGPPDGRRALAYEFCIPATPACRAEVATIDSTVQFMSASGRIGCSRDEWLCVGSTHQENFREALRRLAGLSYVERIDECFFE